MISEMSMLRVIVILLFAIMFTAVGWVAPLMYATNVPSDMVIESHSFTAQDVTTDTDEHYVCFDRTVYHATSGQVFTELYLIDEDSSNRIEMKSDTMERYFQSGRSTVTTPLDLPDNLREGTYRYLLVVRLNMADGRITRDFTFRSEAFLISDNSSINTSRSAAC